MASEVLGEVEVVLATNTDDLNGFLVLSSELLDVSAVAPTGRSMGRPVPGEDRSVAGHDLGKRRDLAGANAEHLGLRDVVADDDLGLIRLSCLDDHWVSNGASATCGGEQSQGGNDEQKTARRLAFTVSHDISLRE